MVWVVPCGLGLWVCLVGLVIPVAYSLAVFGFASFLVSLL